MPIDAYSLCPGGSGKKIKFCCPELLGDFQKLDRMIEGEQYLAALKHIEGLEPKHPDRACLLATKLRLLSFVGQVKEMQATAARFVERYPDNPVALAESAIVTAVNGDGGRAAMKQLQRAISASSESLYDRVYEAMGTVAELLLREGEFQAGRALLQFQMMVSENDPNPGEVLARLNVASTVPLFVKDDLPLASCPDDAPWKARFEEALTPVARGCWLEAAERLGALAEEVADAPVIWRNLALLRSWLADTPGCIEALRKFASLDVPLEDAVEAEALALWMSEDPLGDHLDVLMLSYPVADVEQLQASLSAAPQAVQMPIEAAGQMEDEVPPKAVFWLLSRPMPETTAGITLETVPRVLGRAMLFGRQTDREARLEVWGATSRNHDRIQALLQELAGKELPEDAKQEIVAQVSATREMLQRRWRLPRDASREQFQALADQHEQHVLLEEWPHLPLGLFDEMSPQQVADDEACRVKLLAAIMLLEFWSEQSGNAFDFNRLRSHFGLPTLDPIAPEQLSMDELPLARFSRVIVEKLSDEQLLTAYHRAMAFGVREPLRRFARELVERPGFADDAERQRALSLLARIEEDTDRALDYIQQGRQVAESQGQSSAPWDLMELSARTGRGEIEEASRLLNHLQSEHIREPGVAAALHEFLVGIGAIRPDGTPAAPPPEEEPPAAAPDESGKLWTPDSQKPAGEKPTIWTPGMD